MCSERTVVVPQVFEPGARVAWRSSDLGPRILSHIAGSHWYGVTEDGTEVRLCYANLASIHLDVVAPAPREGQRWVGPGSAATIRADDGTLDVAITGGGWCRGSAVFVARRLLERGYSYAGPADAAPETLRASEPTPAAAPPAPWTRAAARRLITETIACAKPRRPAAFTSAMCSMAERRIPSAELIGSTAKALHALEAALPEHGPVAPWVSERALDVAAACFPEQGWLELADGLDACRFYLARRAS